MADITSVENLPQTLPSIETSEGVREVMERAARGDVAMLPLVRKLFDRDGTMWECYGNSFVHAQLSMVKHATGDHVTIQEALVRRIDALRDDLAGPSPTPLERILCERVALTWFDAHVADRRYSDQASEVSIKTAEYREFRRDRAHKRFLDACKTLAMVRRLGVPAVRINQVVARQQLNLTGSPS